MNRLKPFMVFVQDLLEIWNKERPTQLAAALAYFGMFSFAPIVYIAFSVAGIFINEVVLSERLAAAISEWISPEAVGIFQEMMLQVEKPEPGGRWLASFLSIGVLVYAATGVFFQLKFSLNSIWGLPPLVNGGIVVFIRERSISFLLTVGVGLVLLAAGFFSAFSSWLDTIMPYGWIDPLSSMLVFTGLMAASFAVMYKILPDVKIRWRDVWPGALTSAVLVTLAIRVLGFLLGISTFQSALEASGSVAILLIGINYLAQIFLLGAIIIRVYAQRYGSLREVPSALGKELEKDEE
jgi:membrane protein